MKLARSFVLCAVTALAARPLQSGQRAAAADWHLRDRQPVQLAYAMNKVIPEAKALRGIVLDWPVSEARKLGTGWVSLPFALYRIKLE